VVCVTTHGRWVDSSSSVCCRFTSLPAGCPSPASSSAPAASHPVRWPARSPWPTPGTSPASRPAGTRVPWSTHHLWSSPSRAPSSAPALRRALWAPQPQWGWVTPGACRALLSMGATCLLPPHPASSGASAMGAVGHAKHGRRRGQQEKQRDN